MSTFRRATALLLLVCTTAAPWAAAWSFCCAAEPSQASQAVGNCCHKSAPVRVPHGTCPISGQQKNPASCCCAPAQPALLSVDRAIDKAGPHDDGQLWLAADVAAPPAPNALRVSDMEPGLSRPVHPPLPVLFCVWLK